jgi:hypothetical protein
MSEENFSEEYVPQSNWMKFEQVGDYVKGTFLSKELKEGTDGFPAQMVYELTRCEAVSNGVKLELDKDDSILVGISKDFVNQKLKKVERGRRIGVKFEKEIPASKKGYAPAKSLLPYVWEMDATFEVMENLGGEEVSEGEINVKSVPFA